MRGIQQLLTHLFTGTFTVHPGDFGTRRHHAAQGAGSQRQHAADHIALFFSKGLIHFTRCRFVRLLLRPLLPHQAHDGLRRAFAHRATRLMLDEVTTCNLVKQLDQDREANRGVQIAFRNMQTETFSYQAQANHQQEAQTEHHDGRVGVHEAR